jgi:hypothetical protein
MMEIGRVRVMEFSATFNNISVISWLSVLLVESCRKTSKHKLIKHYTKQICKGCHGNDLFSYKS